MEKIDLKKRKEMIQRLFSSDEWNEQKNFKKDCIPNFISYRDSGILCKMDCNKCKIHDYMPLGLESLIANGFNGILKKQQKQEV